MKYRTIKKSIYKILESDTNTDIRYLRARKYFIKMFRAQNPTADLTSKEKIEKAIPVLSRILAENDTPILFKQLLPNSDINRTSDFIEFLKEVTK